MCENHRLFLIIINRYWNVAHIAELHIRLRSTFEGRVSVRRCSKCESSAEDARNVALIEKRRRKLCTDEKITLCFVERKSLLCDLHFFNLKKIEIAEKHIYERARNFESLRPRGEKNKLCYQTPSFIICKSQTRYCKYCE